MNDFKSPPEAGRFNETSRAFKPLSMPRSTLAGDFCSGGGLRSLMGETGTCKPGCRDADGSRALHCSSCPPNAVPDLDASFLFPF
jgi:hypothetical protein